MATLSPAEALTEHGITALKSGYKSQAREFLCRSLLLDARNEKAWLWLSGAVGNDAERKFCLERVLAINGQNEAARRGLSMLPVGTVSRSPLLPFQKNPIAAKPRAASQSIPKTKSPNIRKQSVFPFQLVIGAVLAAFALQWLSSISASSSSPTVAQKPIYVPVNKAQTTGLIADEEHSEFFALEITLKGIEWTSGSAVEKPKEGYTYAILHLKVKNLGPGNVQALSMYPLQVLDTNGAFIGREISVLAKGCGDIDHLDLIPNGTIEGCAVFEVPMIGKIDLIYAPYAQDRLGKGRYLSFNLRP